MLLRSILIFNLRLVASVLSLCFIWVFFLAFWLCVLYESRCFVFIFIYYLSLVSCFLSFFVPWGLLLRSILMYYVRLVASFLSLCIAWAVLLLSVLHESPCQVLSSTFMLSSSSTCSCCSFSFCCFTNTWREQGEIFYRDIYEALRKSSHWEGPYFFLNR